MDTDALVSALREGAAETAAKLECAVETTTEWKAAEDIARLTRELGEADRRAGAAERSLEWERDANQKARQWRDKQKVEAGYNPNVSFDVVWTETLAKAQQADAARAELAATKALVEKMMSIGDEMGTIRHAIKNGHTVWQFDMVLTERKAMMWHAWHEAAMHWNSGGVLGQTYENAIAPYLSALKEAPHE